MIESFVAVKPQTFSEFYTIAKTSENNYKKSFSNKPFVDKNKNVKQSQNMSNDKSKRKPPVHAVYARD